MQQLWSGRRCDDGRDRFAQSGDGIWPVEGVGRARYLSTGGQRLLPHLFRPATAYGLSPRMRFDIVLNNLVAWAVTTGHIHLKSDGTPWRPIVHIEDISRAFLAALEAPLDAVNNQAFNVGQTAHNYRIRDLAEIVAAVVPGCDIAFAQGAGPDTRNYRVSCEKIGRVLPAFKPQWDARKGAEQLYTTYIASGLKLEEFEGPRYQRIAHINKLLADGVVDTALRSSVLGQPGTVAVV